MLNAFASLKCSKNASIMYKSLSVTAMVLSSDSSDRFRFGLPPCSKELLTLNFKGIFSLKDVITPKITVKLKTATLKANSLTVPSFSQTRIFFYHPFYLSQFGQVYVLAEISPPLLFCLYLFKSKETFCGILLPLCGVNVSNWKSLKIFSLFPTSSGHLCTYCKLFSQFLNHSNKKKSSFFSFLSIGR